MAQRSSGDPFHDLHEAGAKRHPKAWFVANLKAVDAARDELGRHDMSEVEKFLVTRVVLAVLDATQPKPKAARQRGGSDG